MNLNLNTELGYAVFVTAFMLAQYIYFAMRAGLARDKDQKVVAPAMTGSEEFEKKLRVQLNTLEQLVVALPALWLCAVFFRADVAAILGLIFLVARFVYSVGYLSTDVKNRAAGMILSMLSNVVMLGCAVFGAARSLL